MNDILPINTLADRPGPGHNSPPLPEVLAEELADARTRMGELLLSASRARIETSEDVGKVADLIMLTRYEEKQLERLRDARKRPSMLDCRTIDAAYGAVIGPLARARLDTLTPMLAEWRQEHPDAQINASIASVGSRREIAFVIDDLPAVVDWLLQHHGGALAQAARTIIGSVLRSGGVEHAAEASIPGVTVTIKNKAQVK